MQLSSFFLGPMPNALTIYWLVMQTTHTVLSSIPDDMAALISPTIFSCHSKHTSVVTPLQHELRQ